MSTYNSCKVIFAFSLIVFAYFLLVVEANGWDSGHDVIRIVHPPQVHWGGVGHFGGSGHGIRNSHWGSSNIGHWGGNSHNRRRPNGHNRNNNRNNNNRHNIINERINCTGNVVAVRHARCDRYYQCVNNQATLRLCPHGRRFDVDFLECLPTIEANCVPINSSSSSTPSSISTTTTTTGASTTTVQASTTPSTTTTTPRQALAGGVN